MQRTTRVIDSEAIYDGDAHPRFNGCRVQIVAVLRGARVLTDDAAIGCLRKTDLVACAPETGANGSRKFDWQTFEATPADLKFD